MTWRLVVALATTALFLCTSGRADVRPRPRASRSPAVRDSGDTLAADSMQGHAASTVSRLSRARISVWGAGSIHAGGIIGTIPEGWFGLLGIRYHRLLIPASGEALSAPDGPTLTYTADAIPFAAVSIPKGTPPETYSPSIRSVSETGLSTHGFGVYPVGLRVGFRPSRPLRPFIAGHTGFVYLFDPLPDERGRQMNFAVGVGGGVEISTTHRTTLTLGYRYHHLSNGFRASINPGLDANLLYLGLGLSL